MALGRSNFLDNLRYARERTDLAEVGCVSDHTSGPHKDFSGMVRQARCGRLLCKSLAKLCDCTGSASKGRWFQSMSELIESRQHANTASGHVSPRDSEFAEINCVLASRLPRPRLLKQWCAPQQTGVWIFYNGDGLSVSANEQQSENETHQHIAGAHRSPPMRCQACQAPRLSSAPHRPSLLQILHR